LSITDIAVFQAVKIEVMKGGMDVAETARNAPVIVGRDALVRAYVTPSSDYAGRAVTAELTLSDKSGATIAVVKDTKTVLAASDDATLSSTFNFDVAGANLPRGVHYSIALRDPMGDPAEQPAGAMYPAGGAPTPLGAKSTGAQLKVEIVPVLFGADGSNRAPDTSAGQLSLYEQAMYNFYPAAKVDISVGQPMSYSSPVEASGNGWQELLQALVARRASDGAPDDVYYFGAFSPADTFSYFCQMGCVAGLSNIDENPSDATVRASIGLGFSGKPMATTMAHEIGHAHGRAHAPCGGAAQPDPQFPYSGGDIGDWGYDLHLKQLYAPSDGKDLMGYCQPTWISDYTYSALYERMALVNNVQQRAIDFVAPRAYRFVSVDPRGGARWGTTTMLHRRPAGELHTVRYLAGDGKVIGTETGHFYRYDHLGGGFLLVPEAPAGAASVVIAGLSAQVQLGAR
jgi:hypothetical protein